MKTQQKKKLLELANLLDEAHGIIRNGLEKQDRVTAATCLEECQNTAIAIGTTIDKIEGDGTTAVTSLEYYCELTYTIHEQILSGEQIDPRKIDKKLSKSLLDIKNIIKYDIPEIKEIVFLPYKASMWDSLESVWKKASEDPNYEAKVIPIPYYDKNPDGSFGELHYEGLDFPEYVPVTNYENYDFVQNHPDEIYIHNPYDEYNIVTSVHPFFYSKNLKQYTDKLIYIPYFVLEEIDLNNNEAIEKLAHLAQVPGVINADLVIVQSENIRQFYIESMVLLGGEKLRKTFEEKIIGSGSPKIEKIVNLKQQGVEVPKEWEKYIFRPDGSKRTVLLYNTSISALLEQSENMLVKMEQVFEYMKSLKDNVVLLWRPHPLIKATISAMRPALWDEYLKLVDKYRQDAWGIYDDSADMDRALVIADAYYGDSSSLVTLCKAIHMPIMIQNAAVQNITDEKVS